VGASRSQFVLLIVATTLSATEERPALALLEVPAMQHIQEMCTPPPEVVLAEFRVQKGIADPKAQPAAEPETIVEEPAEEAVLTPRSGESQRSHIGHETHACSIVFSGNQTCLYTTFRAEALAMLPSVCIQLSNGPDPYVCLFPVCQHAGTKRTFIAGSSKVPFAFLAGMRLCNHLIVSIIFALCEDASMLACGCRGPVRGARGCLCR